MSVTSLSYQTSPALCITAEADVNEAYQLMEEHDVSSLAVVGDHGRLVGVISRTDLLRIGRREAGTSHDASSLTLPFRPVREMMTSAVVTVGPEDSVRAAARTMVDKHVHRVFIVDAQQQPLGVISTRDLMLSVRDSRMKEPIENFMSSPVFTIRAHEPVSEALQRLEKAHISGLVVLDEEWPVGVFTQRDALLFQHVPRSTPVEDVMNPAILFLPRECQMFRAAAQAVSLRARRVLVSDGKKVVGIVTGLDFARAAAH